MKDTDCLKVLIKTLIDIVNEQNNFLNKTLKFNENLMHCEFQFWGYLVSSYHQGLNFIRVSLYYVIILH